MKGTIKDSHRLALSLVAFAFLAGLPQRMQGQNCNLSMYPQYSTYTSYSTDGTNIYTSVTVNGTTYGYCPQGCQWNCNSIMHTPQAYNLNGSVGGWGYGTPVLWNGYANYTNNQTLAATRNTEYVFRYETQVYCSVAGLFYQSGMGAAYLRIVEDTVKTWNDLGAGVCLTQSDCIGGVTPICTEPEVFSSSPCASGFFCECLAVRFSQSDPYSCEVAICSPTTILPGRCDHY